MDLEYTVQPGSADVFLSYSHADKDAVESLAALIQGAGFTCWIDKERLRAGERYSPAIDKAIENSMVFIAFLSRSYVNDKVYCCHEFDWAMDKHKCILSVCIDDINEKANRQARYMFSFCAGESILGFHCGIGDSLERFAEEIIKSVPLECLKRYYITGDKSKLPPIRTPDYIMAYLRLHHENQYEQSGNYALDEIRQELFPAIKSAELDVHYKDESSGNVSLIQLFSDERISSHKHVLITGEGGMGKTVSLLRCCDYLLSREISAIYVPLSKINKGCTLSDYLENTVCRRSGRIWQDIKHLMGDEYTDDPNVVLLLDGINEIPFDYLNDFWNNLNVNYLNCNGLRVIMTSRWRDTERLQGRSEKIEYLEMQELDLKSIDLYLRNNGLKAVENERILSVIKTPLMLTLYADVEKHRDKYEGIEGISLERNPNTAGKILSNFFQTQLFRAAREENFDRAAHLVLLEYLLPSVAYKMLNNGHLYLSEDEVYDSINEISDGCPLYESYRRNTLRRIRGARSSRINAEELLDLAESSLHFLIKSDEGYEFLHQSFRDYFASFHIANEMRALEKDDSLRERIDPVLEKTLYSDEILQFVADIIREEEMTPRMTEQGWEFVDKEGVSDPGRSITERILELWRDRAEEEDRAAVANLLNIMRLGRRGNLAWCDFSRLDLRACKLNGCRFTVWYKNSYYPSTFDFSKLSRENFINDGHEAKITAIVYNGESSIFSGDEDGVVKCYSLKEKAWVGTIQLQTSKVVDLATDKSGELLAVMHQNIVFCYSIKEKRVIKSFPSGVRSKSFRYVRFSEDGEMRVSYDLEPLIWYDTKGERLVSEGFTDVPARCAAWNPTRPQYMRSYLYQQLGVSGYNEETGAGEAPPKIENGGEAELAKRNETPEALHAQLLSLRDVYDTLRRRTRDELRESVSCIHYSSDGKKVLVAIEGLLVEYDTEHFTVLNKKLFPSNLRCACYIKDEIAVAIGYNLMFLEPNFRIRGEVQGTKAETIRIVKEDHTGEGYYIVTAGKVIKKLSPELTVQNTRRLSGRMGFDWVRDRKTGDIQMGFLPQEDYPRGARYTYETNSMEPLGWRYEFLDPVEYSSYEEKRWYKMGASLLTLERQPPYRKIVFKNYSGITIFRCSFKNIEGDMASSQNIEFLRQNGGIVND